MDALQRLIQHAYDNAPAVRAILEAASLLPGDIRTEADLELVPVTSKDRLVELQHRDPPFGGFLTVPPSSLAHVFFSPGPLYEPHAGESAVTDTIREVLAVAGVGNGDVVLNTFGYHLIPTGLAIDEALRAAGATVIPAGVGNADLQVKMLIDLQVTGYVGTPSWLMALLNAAERLGVELKQLALRVALVSAEPMPAGLRQTFVEKAGLRVINAYGTAELGFLAYDIEGGLAMRLLESAIIQVAHPETGQSVAPGEVGEVVVTSFNETYPLIRLGTGDLAMNLDPAPGMSQQRDRSIILVGRVGDAVKVRGMFVHPNQLRFAVSQIPGVARVQAVVGRKENRDQLILRVVVGDGDGDRDAIVAGLTAAVQSTCRVRADGYEFVDAGDLDEGAPAIRDERAWQG